MDLSIIKSKLKTKKIALVGNPLEIAQYYKSAKHIVDAFLVFEKESLEAEELSCFKDIKTSMFGEDDLEKYYYILCSGKTVTFDKMYRAFVNNGLQYIEQFVGTDIVSAAMDEKEIICVLGTAFMRQVASALCIHPEVKDRFLISYFPFSEILESYIDRFIECKLCIEVSSLLIMSNCKDINYLNNLSKVATKVIKVSDVYFRGYFPQYSDNRYRYSEYMYRERKRTELNYSTYYFAKHDENILQFCLDNMESDEIIKRIGSLDYYSDDELEKLYCGELEKVKEIDADSDITLAELIENNKRCYPINLEEWSVETVLYVVSQVLNRLNICATEKEAIMVNIDSEKGSTLPIYPCVKNKYGIVEDEKVVFLSYTKNEQISVHEFWHRQIEYLKTAIDMNDFLFGRES